MVGSEPELNTDTTIRKTKESVFKPYYLLLEDEEADDDDEDDKDDHLGCLVTPLVQVFSVRIFTNFDDGKPSEIYGSIRALEGPKTRFVLYDSASVDSETITEEGTAISLIGPEGGAIIPCLSSVLDFCLKDRIRGVEVVNEKLFFDNVTVDSYDSILHHDVKGPNGFARVYFIVFKFAVYGIVKVKITEEYYAYKKCNACDIYGSIVARYENGMMYCTSDQQLNTLETRLFDKQPLQPLPLVIGTPIKLSRNVVVGPAYAPLTIELNLWDSNGKMVEDCLRFAPYAREDPSRLRTENAYVQVKVRWHDAHSYLYRDRIMKDSINKQKEMQIKPLIGYDPPPPGSRNAPPVGFGIGFGVGKVEVYTVFVGGIFQSITALCGVIVVDDGSDLFSIYKREDNCFELLPSNGFASIEFNYRAIKNNTFGLTLCLRDPLSNLEVCRGFVDWSECRLYSVPWAIKRQCSLIRGDDGYAVVHYEFFQCAFEAFVKVKLCSNGGQCNPINLYGTMLGYYSGRSYSRYEKQYYRSRLFDKPRDKSIELKPTYEGSEVVLMKSIVVVPNSASLIVEANLGVFGIDNVDEPIKGTAKFVINFRIPYFSETIGKGKGHTWIEVEVSYGL